jgi:hypothetical protein
MSSREERSMATINRSVACIIGMIPTP